MPEYTITIKCEDEQELKSIVNATRNQRLLDGIYDEIFRPVIRYSEDEAVIIVYEEVWKKFSSYLEDE